MKDYSRNKLHYLGEEGKPSKLSMLLFVAVIVFALFVVAFSLWNTIAMQHASKESAREYVSELVVQIAGTVSTDQNDKKVMLSGMSDAVELLLADGVQETSSEEYLQSYLNSVNSAGQFAYLVYLRNSGEPVKAGSFDSNAAVNIDFSHPVVEEALEKNECVAYIESDEVLFAVPVGSGTAPDGVLVGGVDASTLRDLVDVQTYRDESNFCVTNQDGKLLVASGDGRFEQLAELFENGSESSNSISAELENDLKNSTVDVIDVRFDDGKGYFLACAPVDGEDWVMLTLLPVDLFSGAYLAYMVRALACTLGAAVVFVVLLWLLRSVYSSTRKHLEQLAYTDELTGGINEAEFQARFDALKRKEDPLQYSIVMLDIKDFKLVNEAAGFSQGDQVLRRVYTSISLLLSARKSEFVARSEMDHYFVCLRENTLEGIQERLDTITKQVNKDCFTSNNAYSIEFWQGACVVDDAEADAVIFMERARIAGHNSNSRNFKRCVLFNDEMQKSIYENRKLDRLAEASIRNHDFVVYYQPKVSMSTGKAKGAEALVRWNHPEKGFISPADFIPVLEESGRIQALDQYVFEEVCRWIVSRNREGKPVVPVSVNLSRVHFWHDGFVDDYVAIADKYAIDRSYVEFEVTETVFAEEAWREKIKEGIRRMHEYGFRCAVDDFGVGYSSLSLVHEMDVDILKFDRSFFTELGAEKSQIIARNLINMASELHIEVVIEGIETQEQIDFLMNEQCDVVQGYYYSKPLPELEFDAFIEKSAAK